MKILITGASGYLGNRLAIHLIQKGHQICLLVRDASIATRLNDIVDFVHISRYSNDLDIHRCINDFQPDAVVHAAGCYGRKGQSLLDILDANVRFGLVLVECLVQQVRETVFLNIGTSLDSCVSPYSKSKNDFSNWGAVAVTRASQLKFINVQLQQFYGEGDDLSKFPAKVLHTCFRNEVDLALTHGNQLRDFIYVDDVVSGMTLLLKSAALFPPYIDVELGTGKSVSIKKFVQTVHTLTDSKTNLMFGAVETRANEPEEIKAIPDILRSLGWCPSYSLDEGLKKTIKLEFGRER